MPAIDKRIQEWRSHMMQKEAFKSEDLDELESHLLDEIDSLGEKGLTEEEAFLISAHRLGDGNNLGKEFLKINSGIFWKQRIFWMLGGYFLVQLFLTWIYAAQSAYLFWIDWGTLPNFLMGPQFRMPIIPGVLSVLLIGLLYLGLTKRPPESSRLLQLAGALRQRKTLGTFLILAAVIAALAGWPVLQLFLVRAASPQMAGQIYGANSLFNGIFKLLLAVFFVQLAVWYFSENRAEKRSE